MNSQHSIDVCNSLLQGERSAVELYDRAIEHLQPFSESSVLARIRDEHRDAVGMLERQVYELGGAPMENAGAWGAVAHAILSLSTWLGERAALQVLMLGEAGAEGFYESALEDQKVISDCKRMIRANLLPRTDEHVGCLEDLTDSVETASRAEAK